MIRSVLLQAADEAVKSDGLGILDWATIAALVTALGAVLTPLVARSGERALRNRILKDLDIHERIRHRIEYQEQRTALEKLLGRELEALVRTEPSRRWRVARTLSIVIMYLLIVLYWLLYTIMGRTPLPWGWFIVIPLIASSLVLITSSVGGVIASWNARRLR